MTITEIAKMAGVAPATVSRYLNNGYVSEEKREIIGRVIEETGYKPQAAAQTMRTGKSNIIAVIVPKLDSESISSMVNGITSALAEVNYNPIIANTSNSTKKELEFLRIFKDGDADGVILIGTILTPEHYRIMKTYNKPIVVLAQHDRRCSCVYYDDFGAAYDIVTHMAERGCKHIANIFVLKSDKAAGESRIEGYMQALSDAGLEYDERLSAESAFTVSDGYIAMQEIIDRGIEFDGVFCATDSIAFGANSCLEDNGFRVPQDVKIAGVGGSRLSTVIRPSITTAALPYREGGEEACSMLLEQLGDKTNTVRQCRLGSELIIRTSTDAG